MFITHLAFALFLGLSVLKIFNLQVSTPIFIFLILSGSVFPDIDSGTSFIGRKFKLVSWFFKHRGAIHSIAVMIVSSIIIFLLTNNIYFFLAFAAGFLSHLLLDSLTPSGVAFFWPNKKRTRGKFKTMSLFDLILLILFALLDLLILM